MNFLAHALVAARTGSGSPDRALGAVLPDLAAMARVHPVGDRVAGELGDGIACHHETDRAFHADRDFTAGARDLRIAALGAGLPPGASRVVGHLGWELLLDGELLARTEAADAFAGALAVAPSAGAVFAPADRARWVVLVDRLATTRWWRSYDDPLVVAEALQRRVRSRPRLAFGTGDVPTVAEVLDGSRGSVARAAFPVLDRVVVRVGGRTPAGAAGAR